MMVLDQAFVKFRDFSFASLAAFLEASSSLGRRTRWPTRRSQVGCDDDAGALIELAQQMEEQRAAGGAKRQVAKLVEDDESQARRG